MAVMATVPSFNSPAGYSSFMGDAGSVPLSDSPVTPCKDWSGSLEVAIVPEVEKVIGSARAVVASRASTSAAPERRGDTANHVRVAMIASNEGREQAHPDNPWVPPECTSAARPVNADRGQPGLAV